jgi:hypothetical protein
MFRHDKITIRIKENEKKKIFKNFFLASPNIKLSEIFSDIKHKLNYPVKFLS